MALHRPASRRWNNPQIGASHDIPAADGRISGERSRHRTAPRHRTIRQDSGGLPQVQTINSALHVELTALDELGLTGDIGAERFSRHLP